MAEQQQLAERQDVPDWIEKYRAAMTQSQERPPSFDWLRIRSLLATVAVTLAAVLAVLAGLILIFGSIYQAGS